MQEEQHEKRSNVRRIAGQEEQCEKSSNMKGVVTRQDQQCEEQPKKDWKCEEQ
jgi:hypothetical protein